MSHPMMVDRPVLDEDSPYLDTPMWRNAKGYWIVGLPEHPICPASKKMGLHRAVKFDEVGSGPHACHWCKWPGLTWALIVVDHIEGNPDLNRRSDLAISCKWCNDNRSAVENLELGFERFVDTPPAKRRQLKRGDTPTVYARSLQAEVEPEAAAPTEPYEGKYGPLREGFPSWQQALDPTPPEWLRDAYPWLAEELGQ